jgi:selenocysteine lyase/cysteine desulfurase
MTLNDKIKDTVTQELTDEIKKAVRTEMLKQTKTLQSYSKTMKETLTQHNENMKKFFNFDDVQRVVFWASPITTLIFLVVALLRFLGFF